MSEEKQYSVGDKVKVVKIGKGPDNHEEAESKVGKVGRVTIVDLCYEYPYNVVFEDGSELMFKYEELELIK